MPGTPVAGSAPAERLDSWKAIAAYLQRGTRTVQRWEREEGLPIHRLHHDKAGSVYAYKAELDDWWQKRRATLDPETTAAPEQEAAPRKPRGWTRWAGTLTAALVVAGLAAWLLAGRARPGGSQPKVVPLTSYAGFESWPAFSPDGSQVAFTWNGEKQDNPDIYTKLIGTERLRRLTTDPAGDIQPVWSPDGATVAFLRTSSGPRSQVRLIPAGGGAERQIGETWDGRSEVPDPLLAWSPDARWLIVSDRLSGQEPYSLTLLSVESGEKRRLTAPPPQALGDSAAAVSRDGRTVAFIRCATAAVCDLYVLDMTPDFTAHGEPRRLTTARAMLSTPLWTAGGRDIYFVREQSGAPTLWKVPAEGSQPARLAGFAAVGYHLAMSRGGDRLAYVQGYADRDIYRLDLGGETLGTPERWISSTRIDVNPDYSPDGKRIAFGSLRSGTREIWVCDANGANPVQLTSFGGPAAVTPRWSPAGDEIAFTVEAGGRYTIQVVRATGGAPRLLTAGSGDAVAPSWSRDGKWVYFGSDRSGTAQIWKVAAAGGEARRLTQLGGHAAQESADGKFVYYGKLRADDSASLWRIAAAGGTEVEIVGTLRDPWSFFVSAEGVHLIQPGPARAKSPLAFYRFATRQVEPLGVISRQLSPGLGLWPAANPLTMLFAAAEPPTGDLILVDGFPG